MKGKIDMYKVKMLSLSIVSCLIAQNGFSAYNLNEDYKFTPNGVATGRVTGPLEGSKPAIDLIQVRDAATITQAAGNSIVIDFMQAGNYKFNDLDKDIDISINNFSWYIFKNPISLVKELLGPTPPTIEALIERGDAQKVTHGITSNQNKIEVSVPVLEANSSLGFVIQPETSSGYPIETRKNTPLIVPSISYSGKVNFDGTISLVDLASIKGIILLKADENSLSQYVPPRDIRNIANINDDENNIEQWKTIQFIASVVEPLQRDVNIDLNGNIGTWNIDLSVDGSILENLTIVNNGVLNNAAIDKLSELDVKLKSGPTYDETNKRVILELASNKPIQAKVKVDFNSFNDAFIDELGSSSKEFSFNDRPSENIELVIYDRGIDGKSTREEVSNNDPIYPNHVYEVAVYDKDNLIIDNKPTDVTGYFANYIKWTYTEPALPGQYVQLARCNGTVMFPTQTTNQNAEQELKDLSTTDWPNFEQGLRLKPTIDLPAGILSGNDSFSRISGQSMLMCDPSKTGQAHIPYSWFE